ncbi:MAG: hypothetical protein R2789_11250 [Microthrixaceae bacterium]
MKAAAVDAATTPRGSSQAIISLPLVGTFVPSSDRPTGHGSHHQHQHPPPARGSPDLVDHLVDLDQRTQHDEQRSDDEHLEGLAEPPISAPPESIRWFATTKPRVTGRTDLPPDRNTSAALNAATANRRATAASI